tara:strand:+ start:292 stop:684 length:393 start_codon:yes stop_codon:yes gene_type:complete
MPEAIGSNASKYVWWVERDAIWIAKYYPSTGNFGSPDSALIDVHLFYYKKPDDFALPSASDTWEAQQPEFTSSYHQALVNKAAAIGFEKKGDYNSAGYWGQKFEKDVRDARGYAYRGRVSQFKQIAGQEY